jgi:hypothetical protein
MKPLPLGWRRAVRAALTATAVASVTLVPATLVPATAAQAQAGCPAVDYQASSWSTGATGGGFVAGITITNACGAPVDGWALGLTLPPGHGFSHGWSANWASTGAQVTATPHTWNRVLNPGAAITIGFVGTWTGTYQDPLTCTINGRSCEGGPVGNEPPEVTLTSPQAGFFDALGCAVRFAAEASDPDGTVDRVEFYANGVLIGTDDAAPYEIEHASNPLRHGDNTAQARVFDDGNPSLHADSQTVTFQLATPPPGGPPVECRSGIPPAPPVVTLTRPSSSLVGVVSPCPFVLSADANDPDGAIDRVEFYLNNMLVGTDRTAPYLIEIGALPPPLPSSAEWVAFARAYDNDVPQLSADSQARTFRIAIGDPLPESIFACTGTLRLAAGGSEPLRFGLFSTTVDEVTLTVTGDPRITVSPTTVVRSGGLIQATVTAAPGSTGATATITATGGNLRPTSTLVIVS